MYLWSAATKEMKLVSKHEGTATYEPSTFDPASRWLYYLTNDGGEFARVARYELAPGTTEDVEKADWDVEWTFFSHDGRYRVSAVNQDGRSVLHVFDGKTGAAVPSRRFPRAKSPPSGCRAARRSSPSSWTAIAGRTISTCTSSARRRRCA